jgi:hypothetical protein
MVTGTTPYNFRESRIWVKEPAGRERISLGNLEGNVPFNLPILGIDFPTFSVPLAFFVQRDPGTIYGKEKNEGKTQQEIID